MQAWASGDRPPGWEAFSAVAGWLGQLPIPSLCLSFHLPSSTLPGPGCHGTSLIRQADPCALVEVLVGLASGSWRRGPQCQGRVNVLGRCLKKVLPEQQEAQDQFRLGGPEEVAELHGEKVEA